MYNTGGVAQRGSSIIHVTSDLLISRLNKPLQTREVNKMHSQRTHFVWIHWVLIICVSRVNEIVSDSQGITWGRYDLIISIWALTSLVRLCINLSFRITYMCKRLHEDITMRFVDMAEKYQQQWNYSSGQHSYSYAIYPAPTSGLVKMKKKLFIAKNNV